MRFDPRANRYADELRGLVPQREFVMDRLDAWRGYGSANPSPCSCCIARGAPRQWPQMQSACAAAVPQLTEGTLGSA